MVAVAVDVLESDNAPYGSVAYWRAAAAYLEHFARYARHETIQDAAARAATAAHIRAGKAYVLELRHKVGPRFVEANDRRDDERD